MDPTRLKTLRELALKGTMAAVSDRLHLTPSAISQQIAQLEQEAGVELIERVGRGVRLTEAGHRLVTHVERIVSALEDARTEMEELRGTVSGTIRVMAFPSIAAAVLPRAAELLAQSHPGLSLICENLEPQPALAALKSWQCDLAFMDDLTLPPQPDLRRLELAPVLRDELVAVLPANHPLAHAPKVALTALAELPWAMDPRPDTFSDVIERICVSAGFHPNVVVRFDGYSVISAFIARGGAVSLLPRARITLPLAEGIAVRPLAEPVLRNIAMATRYGELRRPPLRAVAEAIQTVCSELVAVGRFCRPPQRFSAASSPGLSQTSQNLTA